jgi:hypothetical protein
MMGELRGRYSNGMKIYHFHGISTGSSILEHFSLKKQKLDSILVSFPFFLSRNKNNPPFSYPPCSPNGQGIGISEIVWVINWAFR